MLLLLPCVGVVVLLLLLLLLLWCEVYPAAGRDCIGQRGRVWRECKEGQRGGGSI